MVPAEEDVAWNSQIGVYGANGTEPSTQLFLEGDAIRPFGGKVDNTGQLTRIVFEGGNITRYDNYSADVSGREYGGLTILPEQNAVELPTKASEDDGIIIYGLNASSKKISVFEKGPDVKPKQGFVIFHGIPSHASCSGRAI